MPTGRQEPNQSRFADFIRQRQELNQRLAETRVALDEWLEREPYPPSMVALANLEVLLKTRRDLLSALVQLDDEFMAYLIELKGREFSQ